MACFLGRTCCVTCAVGRDSRTLVDRRPKLTGFWVEPQRRSAKTLAAGGAGLPAGNSRPARPGRCTLARAQRFRLFSQALFATTLLALANRDRDGPSDDSTRWAWREKPCAASPWSRRGVLAQDSLSPQRLGTGPSRRSASLGCRRLLAREMASVPGEQTFWAPFPPSTDLDGVWWGQRFCQMQPSLESRPADVASRANGRSVQRKAIATRWPFPPFFLSFY